MLLFYKYKLFSLNKIAGNNYKHLCPYYSYFWNIIILSTRIFLDQFIHKFKTWYISHQHVESSVPSVPIKVRESPPSTRSLSSPPLLLLILSSITPKFLDILGVFWSFLLGQIIPITHEISGTILVDFDHFS